MMRRKTIYYWAAVFTIIMAIIATLTATGFLPVSLSKIFPSISNILSKTISGSKIEFGPQWIDLEKPVLILEERCTLIYYLPPSRGITSGPHPVFVIQSSERVFWRDPWDDQSLFLGGDGHSATLALSLGGNKRFLLSGDEFSRWVLEFDSARAKVVVKSE